MLLTRFVLLIGTSSLAFLYAQTPPAGDHPIAKNGWYMTGSRTEELIKSPPGLPKEAESEFRAIQYYFDHPDTEGRALLGRLGDRAAFYLYVIMIQRPPLNVQETHRVLDLLHKAFARPGFITDDGNRTTHDKTLRLLEMLQKTAVDQSVKERIAAETSFVRAVPFTKPVPETLPPSKLIYRPGDGMPRKEDFEPQK